MVNIRISRIEIQDFRGIQDATLSFSDVNFLIGDNGTGKTSCLAAIARLLPILRGEPRIFLDGDFRFSCTGHTKPIRLRYAFTVSTDESRQVEFEVRVVGKRLQDGEIRSNLNDQQPGHVSVEYLRGTQKRLLQIITDGIARYGQRVIRNGWSGGRICPISLRADQDSKHAATSKQEDSRALDGLRARLVQQLSGSELGRAVEKEHPDLARKVIHFANCFLNDNRFFSIELGHSSMLNILRGDGTKQSWDGMSAGERSAFNLAMAIEFSISTGSFFLLVEEPETNLHPTIQKQFVEILQTDLRDIQVFVSTHSPYIFGNSINSANIIIGSKSDHGVTLEVADALQWLFSSPTSGELSFYAYDVPTFEYHNELYGWIQRFNKKQASGLNIK